MGLSSARSLFLPSEDLLYSDVVDYPFDPQYTTYSHMMVPVCHTKTSVIWYGKLYAINHAPFGNLYLKDSSIIFFTTEQRVPRVTYHVKQWNISVFVYLSAMSAGFTYFLPGLFVQVFTTYIIPELLVGKVRAE